MSRWSRFADLLLGQQAADTANPMENPMTTTPLSAIPDPAGDLRRQLAALDDEQAADPVAAAADLDSWRVREQQRTDQRLALAQKLQLTEALGELAADPAAVQAFQQYMRGVADHRGKLAAVARERSWPGGTSDGRAETRLTGWWRALLEMDQALPADHTDSTRIVEREVAAWLAARDGVAAARLAQNGYSVPTPELRGLPRGLAVGVHRPEQP